MATARSADRDPGAASGCVGLLLLSDPLPQKRSAVAHVVASFIPDGHHCLQIVTLDQGLQLLEIATAKLHVRLPLLVQLAILQVRTCSGAVCWDWHCL